MNKAADPRDRPMTHLTAGQALSAGRKVATEALPYFASGILNLVPRERPGLGTLAVTKDSILLYDPETVRGWTPRELASVYTHEYLHIFFNHTARQRKLVNLGLLTLSDADQELFNVAADCEINDNLVAAGMPLPKGPNGEEPCTPGLYELPDHRTAEEYVALLKKKRDEQDQGGGGGGGQDRPAGAPGGAGGGGQDPGEEGGDGGPGQPQAGGGWCGSGGGRAVPNEPQNDPHGRSETDQQAQRRSDAEMVQAAARSRGNVPAGFQRAAAEQLTPPTIPWQTRLRAAAQQAVAFRRGSVDYTRSRPSRRQAGYAGMADAPLLPAMHAPIANVAVVVDTSGSMGDEQMQAILAECQGIFQAQAGVAVTMVACDAAVHTLARVRDVKAVRAGLRGGGGTDFRPAFAALAVAKPRPDVVVFATDGYGPAPESPPPGMRTVWLIVPGGRNSCPWGDVVHIEAPESADDDE